MKGTIISTAFLGVEMKCARCHDAPSHRSTQEELFQLAAMLQQKPITVPLTSSVPMDRFHNLGRKPMITVTLKPGAKVEPKWPFAEFCDAATGKRLAEDPLDSRDQLAAIITAPQNERFAQVMANRIWKRFMGRGIVEPVDDWEKSKPTHPELLRWLGRELVRQNYDVKAFSRIILNSQAYQRSVDPSLHDASPLYIASYPRRISAEQLVDSLFAATGKLLKTEEVSLDIDGIRDLGNAITLGNPRRAWMLTSTSNERDRPSLNLPRVAAVADVLTAFGWRGARQDPLTQRDESPNSLQPAILANGVMTTWLSTLSDDHTLTEQVLLDQPLPQLVDHLFMRTLTRHPTVAELEKYVAYLKPGYDHRIVSLAVSQDQVQLKKPRINEKYISWSNHLDPQATTLRQEQESAARRGETPTLRLEANWRGRMEDVIWTVINAPEWVYIR